MRPRADVPGDLLFGLLALQAGLIDQSALVAAFHTWCRDPNRAMAEILVAREALDEGERQVVAGLVAAHLKRHGGDREESLAALQVDASAVDGLADVGDPDLDATLSRTGLGLRSPRLAPVDPARARLRPRPSLIDGPSEPSVTMDYDPSAHRGPRYRIVRKLGSGGLGVVFVAVDSVLRREVALKQVRPDRDDPQTRARFLVEAEVTGGLEHPGIVAVQDRGWGDGDGGRPYYVMRLVRGDTLKDAIAVFHDDPALRADPSARAVELQKLLRRFLDVCYAVDYAHARGVLHRDIKPSNVVVGKHGETIVIDWGLAKSVGRPDGPSGSDERTLRPTSGADSAETLPGLAMGTPAYMSPEQSRGDIDRIGPRSDVYSLGATLYHLLTGHKPFEGRDRALIQAAVEEGDFPRPRAADPTIAPALEAVCLRAMALAPEDRYGSARELAEEVERWLADAPVTAWREPASVRLRRWARRHRPLVAAAAVLLVMATLTSVGAAVLLDAHRRRIEREQGRTEQARAEADANFGKAIGAVEAMLTRVFDERLASVPQMEPLRRDLAREAATNYDAFLRQRPGDPSVRHGASKVFRRAANVDRQLNRPDQAKQGYERAIALLEDLVVEFPAVPHHREQQAETLIDEAEMLRLQGRPREAEPLHRKAIDLVGALREADPKADRFRRIEATTRSSLGTALNESCRFDESRALLDRAVELRRSLVDVPKPGLLDRLLLALDLANLAEARREDRRHAEAIRAGEEAVRLARALRQERPGENDRRFVLGFTLREHARALADDPARAAEADRTIDESVALFEGLAAEYAATPNDRSRLGQTLMVRGDLRARAGRPADAEADWGRARDLAAALAAEHKETPEYHALLGKALGHLAELTLERGETAKAMLLIDAALPELELALAANPDACRLRAVADGLRAIRPK